MKNDLALLEVGFAGGPCGPATTVARSADIAVHSDRRDAQGLAAAIRRTVVEMTHRAGSSHVGSCLSMADLLAVLYSRTLRVDPSRPESPDRDRFILSKGHGCAALYATLAERGFFPRDWLHGFYCDGSKLAGHVSYPGIPGVEVSTGSLGHGLPIGCGMAVALRRESRCSRIYVLLSDGECDEGSVWEAAMFAAHHRLSNLVAVIDYNHIQSLGRVEDVLDLGPLADKWLAFGWSVREIDGHDVDQIEPALIPAAGRPLCVIAHTVKGKGVPFMENQVLWHYRSPDASELRLAIAALEGKA